MAHMATLSGTSNIPLQTDTDDLVNLGKRKRLRNIFSTLMMTVVMAGARPLEINTAQPRIINTPFPR